MTLPGEVVLPATERPGALGVQLRTRVLRAATRIPHDRLVALERRPVTRPLKRAVDALVRSGPIGVAGGPAVGALLPTALLTIDHAQAGLLARGDVEPPVAEAIRRHLPAGGVLWDVGANLGYFAVLAARLAGPGAQVLAIDPVPGHGASVARAAALNGLDAIRVLEIAAWHEAGELDLVLPDDGAWAHLAATVAGRAPGERLRVAALPLDALLEEPGVRPPDVVKIDVEGAELGVLAGLRRTVLEHRPVLLVETHDTADSVVAWAAEHDYAVTNLEGPGPVAGPGGHLTALVPRGYPRTNGSSAPHRGSRP